MKKEDSYRQTLNTMEDWDAFLLQESGLPGRRANLELAYAVAREGKQALFERYLSFDPEKAPTNSPQEFLAFCGVLGLGKLLAQGQGEVLGMLRRHASDPRWRIREAVAQALQVWGDVDMVALLQEMQVWSEGNLLERRASAAALCEPRLLGEPGQVQHVLRILDGITASLLNVEDRKTDAFQVLRKGLGYCWSVAVAAHPEVGKAAIEKWLTSEDRDIRWIMRQSLRKKRLERMDANWVTEWQGKLGL
jgi:hypothetical protein